MQLLPSYGRGCDTQPSMNTDLFFAGLSSDILSGTLIEQTHYTKPILDVTNHSIKQLFY